MSSFIPNGMGWLPDVPDARDYTHRHDQVWPLLDSLPRSSFEALPAEVDLRRDCEEEYFTGVEDQGPLNCSAVFAVLSLVEYLERRVCGRTFEGSKLFLYKVTRDRDLGRSRSAGDCGAGLRSTLRALTQFGVPPEAHWPYDVERVNEEPDSFLFAIAMRFPGIRYFRLDGPNCDGTATLGCLKSFLAAGFPIAFGFSVPGSLTSDADIPFRPEFDRVRGGQAALAVGYRDNHYGPGQGAILIRSSWGSQWGDNGYGWLPIAFLRRQLAKDCWTVVREDWLDSRELFLPARLVETQSTNLGSG